MLISKEFKFEASHVLPLHPGKCSRLHGHSYGLQVYLDGPVDSMTGFVMDYGVLSKIVHENVIDKLDHTHLGYGSVFTLETLVHDSASYTRTAEPYFGEKFYPSAENLSRAIFKLLKPLINDIKGVRLVEVIIEETSTSSAIWRDLDESDFAADWATITEGPDSATKS